jgi:hypothetical protein
MLNTTNPRIKEIPTYKMKAIAKMSQASKVGNQTKCEEDRKSRLLNVIILFMLVIFIALIPVSLMLANYFEMMANLVMLVSCSIVFIICVNNANASIKRASIAEKVAIEAQQQAELQKAEVEKNMLHLQRSVERIMRNHAMVMNGQNMTQIPLAEYESRLWPLINAFNSLQNRLQHARQTECELRQIKEAIYMLVELIHQGKFSLIQGMRTKTALDMLLNALYAEQEGNLHQEYSPVILNLENTWLKDQLSIPHSSGHGF